MSVKITCYACGELDDFTYGDIWDAYLCHYCAKSAGTIYGKANGYSFPYWKKSLDAIKQNPPCKQCYQQH
jgi:hypothetical protein